MSLFFVFPLWNAFASGCALAKAVFEFERARWGKRSDSLSCSSGAFGLLCAKGGRLGGIDRCSKADIHMIIE
jgi:hypothetical protein